MSSTTPASQRADRSRLTYEKQATGQELVHARLLLGGGGGKMAAIAATLVLR